MTLVDLLSSHGGAERLAWLIANHLDAERFESILCVSRWPPPTSTTAQDPSAALALEQLEVTGTRFVPLGRTRKLDLRALARLRNFLRFENVQILHTHKFGSNVSGSVIGTLAGVPAIVAHEHTWSYEGKPWRRFLDREVVARCADVLIAVSREDQRRMAEVERIDPSRTLFIPNGVPPSPPATGHDVRGELGIAPGTLVIGAIGVMRPQKAFDVLLRATSLLQHTWPDIQVLLAGRGPELATLKALARELGIAGRVHFLGYRSDVPDVLRAIDVAVCCSDFEGSPLAVMECMDAAVPVVATAVGGVPDLIRHETDGLLVPPRDPPALAAAVSQLLADPQLRHNMGQRARERRRSEFSLDTLVHRLEDLYLDLLAQPAQAAMPVAL